jgi:acetyltransferase-like isoleucine patch superfamily enzyme
MTLINKLLFESFIWLKYLFRSLPNSTLGNKIRFIFWKFTNLNLGKNVKVERMTDFLNPVNIFISDNTIFGENVIIDASLSNGIYIGKNASIANGTYIRSANHKFDEIDLPIQNQGHYSAELCYNKKKYSIIIEDDVWVGARAIILSGAWIGRGCIISAGAVISSIIPPFSIVVGNPGRVVANREKKIQERNENI